jgi:hypothetical protein
VRIFISYRRDDTAGHAGRLFDTLRRWYPHPVFMDVEGIPGAEDFFAVIEREIAQSDLLIAVIGRRWLGAVDRGRTHRIDDPRDYVRREIELAMGKGKDIVPVIVGDASMPSASLLPKSLRALARLQAVQISDSRWTADVNRLIDLLKRRAWDQNRRMGLGAGTTQVRAFVPVPLRHGIDAPGSLLVGDRSILVSSPRHHRVWSIGIEEQRLLGGARLASAPFWTPTSMAPMSSYLWVADPWGQAVWRLQSYPGIDLVYRSSRDDEMAGAEGSAAMSEGDGAADENDGTEAPIVEYRRPRLADSRRIHIGFRVGDLAVHRGSGLWVTIPETRRDQARSAVTLPQLAYTRLATSGELLRIDPGSRKVVARLPIPNPRRVASGTESVWVTASDVVARIDTDRNMVAQVVPLDFAPGAIVVGDDTVWVAGSLSSRTNPMEYGRYVAQIDALTGQFVGAVEVPEGFVHCLALGAGSLWAGAHGTVYRIDPRSHTVLESLSLSHWATATVTDIAVVGTLVCVAVASTERSSFRTTGVALLDTVAAD